MAAYPLPYADTAANNDMSRQELISLLKKESALLDLDEEKEADLSEKLDTLQSEVLAKYSIAAELAAEEAASPVRDAVSERGA